MRKSKVISINLKGEKFVTSNMPFLQRVKVSYAFLLGKTITINKGKMKLNKTIIQKIKYQLRKGGK